MYPSGQDEIEFAEEFDKISGEIAGNLAGGFFVVGAVGNLLREGGAEIQDIFVLAHKTCILTVVPLFQRYKGTGQF